MTCNQNSEACHIRWVYMTNAKLPYYGELCQGCYWWTYDNKSIAFYMRLLQGMPRELCWNLAPDFMKFYQENKQLCFTTLKQKK